MKFNLNHTILSIFVVSSMVFTSCAEDVFESETNRMAKISTGIEVEQPKATGVNNLSRSESKAPEFKTYRVEGAKGDMYLRYTAAAGIVGNNSADSVIDSRGRLITTSDFYDDYGLFIYEYPSSSTWATEHTSATPNIVNERVLRGRNWNTNEFWPGGGVKMAFFAYAPYNAAGVSLLPSATTTDYPTFHYVTPADGAMQNDLLVSYPSVFADPANTRGGVDVPGDYNQIKYLRFKHACTGVRLAVGDQMAPCTLKKIVIKGVYGVGDFDYSTMTWKVDNSTTYNYTLNADLVVRATDQNKVINDGKYVFMLLPQTVPSNAVIEMTVDDGEEHVLTANIGGSDWPMGYTVTYYLSTSYVNSNYILSVSTGTSSISGNGGSSTYNVQSYKQTFYGSQVAVPWEATYSVGSDATEYSTPGSTVTAFTNAGSGSITGANYSITLGGAVPVSDPTTNPHTADLRSRAAVSNVNLAAGGETANCYVVTAPGTYKFPLAWGNSIKNNAANTSAYNSEVFVDYKGAKISDVGPYIYNTYQPFDAVLVWQDAPDLVTPSSVKLSSDKHFLEFEVKKDNICQGNCILAVRDKNLDIMWSWHIWVTDYDISAVIPIKATNITLQWMPVVLGFCDAETRTSSATSTIYLHVKQTEGTETANVSFDLGAATMNYGNNAPYFQWGRKDPMVAHTGVAATNKPIYGTYTALNNMSTVDIAVTIRTPYYFNTSNGNPSLELWNVGNTITNASVEPVVKSIYDPSPSGFHLPCSGSFQGWEEGGRTYWQGISGKWGRYLFQLGPNTGNTYFLPVLGYKNSYYSYSYFAGEGDYWTSGPSSSYGGFGMYFNSRTVSTAYLSFGRSCALTVIPVADN